MSSSEDSDSNSSSGNISEVVESENEGDFGVVCRLRNQMKKTKMV